MEHVAAIITGGIVFQGRVQLSHCLGRQWYGGRPRLAHSPWHRGSGCLGQPFCHVGGGHREEAGKSVEWVMETADMWIGGHLHAVSFQFIARWVWFILWEEQRLVRRAICAQAEPMFFQPSHLVKKLTSKGMLVPSNTESPGHAIPKDAGWGAIRLG